MKGTASLIYYLVTTIRICETTKLFTIFLLTVD